jgi:hypothetical protein
VSDVPSEADADLAGLPVRALATGDAGRTGPLFSVCSLVTDAAEYRRMVESFLAHGFGTERTEYLFGDNRAANRFDGYAGLGALIAAASGVYVICCHQDIEVVDDDADRLLAALRQLGETAPDWGVAGNAGVGPDGWATRISDPHGPDQRKGDLPARVASLDENFLVIRRAALLAPSRDLRGYHHYGTDLCLQAALRGWSAHVVDFHLRHHSRGRLDARYFDSAEALEAKYRRAFAARRVPTTFRPLYLTGSPLQGALWRLRGWLRRRKWERRSPPATAA